ncbi:MAG: MBL fold metallo-hydrolase [Ruminococcus sp.]|nr:MBL fold metallo-hydrolase [Ruminococcus sp.]
MSDSKKGRSAKSVFARVLVAVIIIAAGAAALAGHRYGFFDGLDPDESSVPKGFIDENATHAFVEFIDVGEGESVLIGSEGHFMLIDAGDKAAFVKVMKILETEGVKQLDYLLLSNPDAGHIGGAADILWRVKTNCLILPRISDTLTSDSSDFYSVTEAAGGMQVEVRTAGDSHFTLGGCTFDTFVPHKAYEEVGDNSVYVRLCHGDNSFLFTGNSGRAEEEEFVGRGTKLSSNVLKASNHAGRDSCCSELLSSVMPEYTVISCAKNDSRGNPNRDTLRRIRKFSPNVLMTCDYGTIRFDSDGSRIKVSAGYEHISDSSSDNHEENDDSKTDNPS